MFRIGSQPPPQPATQIGSTTTQGGSNTADQFQTLMASLEKAIADIGAKYGGASPGGGDAMELPRSHSGGPQGYGVGMPGGTVGTNSLGFAPGEPAPSGATETTAAPTKNSRMKTALAGASVGTEKHAETHSHHHFDKTPGHHWTHMRPWTGPTTGGVPKSGMAGVSVGTAKSGHQPVLDPTTELKPNPRPVQAIAKGASPGATIGTKTPMATTLTAQAAPAPASTAEAELQKVLSSVPGGGGGPGVAAALQPYVGQGTVTANTAQYLVGMGSGGLAGGVIGTKE